jgi:hypothetical protein
MSSGISSRLIVVLAALLFSVAGFAQVQPAGESGFSNISAGAGLDYWSGDWGGAVERFGPAAWVTADIWHGIGVNAEGHSMIFGGGTSADPKYKYFVGEGGAIYTIHHWRRIRPYMKAEIGFAGLSFPSTGLAYTHENQRTWSFGGGGEIHTWHRLWTRVDYTYDFFPNFYSPISGEYHTLNPRGITFGETFHFR